MQASQISALFRQDYKADAKVRGNKISMTKTPSEQLPPNLRLLDVKLWWQFIDVDTGPSLVGSVALTIQHLHGG